MAVWIAACVLFTGASARAQSLDATRSQMPDPITSSAKLSSARPQVTVKEPVAEAQPGPVDPESYRLGPGDMLELDLWGRVARTQMLEVSPDGKVFLPGAGTFDMAGKTLAWARTRLLSEIARQYRDVKADVRLARVRTVKVYVSGMVKVPGAYSLPATTRVSEVLGQAELLDGASQRDIRVRRVVADTGTALAKRVDLLEFTRMGRVEHNPFIQDGDVIEVGSRRATATLFGAFARPEAFESLPGDSLETFVGLGGGIRPEANQERLLIVRFRDSVHRESLWVGMGPGDPWASQPIQPGDHVYLGFQPNFHEQPSVEIYGEVRRPGAYPIVLGRDRLSDLLDWAGGSSARANRTGAVLIRSVPGTIVDPEFERLARLTRAEMTESEYASFQTRLAERRNSFRVDLDRIEAKGTEVDPLLESGDLVRLDPLVPSVRVEGQVGRPGFVDFKLGRAVDEYVALAGGYTGRAAVGNVRVSRSQTGQVVPAKSVRAVQAGDFIWVPERKEVDPWQVFKDVLSIGGQIALIVVAVRNRP